MNTPDKRSRPGGTANGTLQTTEDGRLVLRYERRLAHPPQRVWRALPEPDPPRVFAFDWGEENLRFELRREGDGCLLVFNNTLDDRSKLARVGAGWHLCFEVLAEPNRRRILDLLRDGERSVGELVELVRISQPGVSKHLRVLRQAGLVTVRIDAQRRCYLLRPEPLTEIDTWIEPYRRYWAGRLDALEAHLDSAEEG